MVKLFCILNAFNRFEQKRVKTSNPLPSRRLSGLSVLGLFIVAGLKKGIQHCTDLDLSTSKIKGLIVLRVAWSIQG